MKKSLFFSLLSILFVLYYFSFPLDGGKEIVWTPALVQDLSRADGKSFPQLDDPEMIHNGSYSGVLMPHGPSMLHEAQGYRQNYSLSHSFTSSDGITSTLVNLTNKNSIEFEIPGYPMIFNGHFLISDASGTLLREVSTSGEILWFWEGVSPVTALTASSMIVVFGTLDGQIHFFRKDGTMASLDSQEAEKDKVVYGLALSEDSSFLVALSGLDDQVLVLYHQSSPLVYTEIARFPLTSHYVRPVKLSIGNEDYSVWVEQPGKVQLYNEEGLVQELEMEGNLLQMLPDEDQHMTLTAETSRSGSLIRARAFTGELVFSDKAQGVLSHFNKTARGFSLVLDNRYLLYTQEAY